MSDGEKTSQRLKDILAAVKCPQMIMFLLFGTIRCHSVAAIYEVWSSQKSSFDLKQRFFKVEILGISGCAWRYEWHPHEILESDKVFLRTEIEFLRYCFCL